jgi:hypothetical protein
MAHELGVAGAFMGRLLEWARPGERMLMAGLGSNEPWS